MKRPIISDEAKKNLKRIFRYIEKDNRSAALRLITRLRETFKLLASQPSMGELRGQFGANIRLFTVGNYVIFFRPKGDTAEILGVVHGARDFESTFQVIDE
jgi:toxin ParE1/3/4